MLEKPYRPAVKDFLASRLKRIELVGKPAPRIQGTDLDGKEFNLAAQKGKAGPGRLLGKLEPAQCRPGHMARAGRTRLSQQGPGGRRHQPRYPGERRPETGNRLAQYPPVLARLQCSLAHSGQRLRGSRLRPGLWSLGYPGQCPDRPDGTVVQIDLSRRNLEPVVSRLLVPVSRPAELIRAKREGDVEAEVASGDWPPPQASRKATAGTCESFPRSAASRRCESTRKRRLTVLQQFLAGIGDRRDRR